MYKRGHLGINLLLYAPVAALLVQTGHLIALFIGAWVMVSFCSLPDIDMKLRRIHIPRHGPLVKHRGFTHTIYFAVLFGLTMAGIAELAIWFSRPQVVGLFRLLGLPLPPGQLAPTAPTTLIYVAWIGTISTVSILGHLLGDVITPSGLRPFAPVSDYHISLSLVKAKNRWANEGFLGLGATAFGVAILAGVPRVRELVSLLL